MQKIFFSRLVVSNSITTMFRANVTSLCLNKQELPKQPVPDLEKTAERYLKSVEPLLSEHEFCNTKKIVEEFVRGQGPLLHSKLKERYESTDNWLSDWWLNTAYLGYRVPVIVNSSPGTVGPNLKLKRKEDIHLAAVRIILAVLSYNQMIKCGDMKQEMSRGDPLDMQPYAMILGTHRRPAPKCDQLIHTDCSEHVIIISNNHFFKLDVVVNRCILTETQLIGAIQDILRCSEVPAKPVGILTGDDRDTWAIHHCTLRELGSNAKILKDIEDSLFVLCIDRDVPKTLFTIKNYASVRALQSLTGLSSNLNAGNRWHDKTIQFIISSDGYFGMEYEHSPCEGVPVAVLHDYVLKFLSSQEFHNICASDDYPKAQHLQFETDKIIDYAIVTASTTVDNISKDIDLECFTFDAFGTEEIKKLKFSPDSFIQIALQVTYYKICGKPPAHYESAALRRFKNARTECIRSTSTASVKFAKASCESYVNKNKLKELMAEAIQVHKEFASEASHGRGVDRLLYGLKMIALSECGEVPELYKDVAYTRSTHFTLTSSQVPFKTSSFMCYGPVVPDGYACCYNPRPNDIIFACSSYKADKNTNTQLFVDTLQQTLHFMKDLHAER